MVEALGAMAELTVAGDASTLNTDDSKRTDASPDEMEKHSQPITWKPFAGLFNLRERLPSKGSTQCGQSQAGEKADRLESCEN